MPDINLIGSEQQKVQRNRSIGSFVTIIFVLILILLLGYYGFLLFSNKKLSDETTTVQAKIAATEQKLRSNSDKNEVFTRQAQLADLKQLLASHLNWSVMVPELARVTLSSASYTEFNSEESGSIVLTVDVATYTDLDKFLQVFDLPQYSQNVSKVKIRSIVKAQEENSLRLRAKIEFTFNEDSLKIKKAGAVN